MADEWASSLVGSPAYEAGEEDGQHQDAADYESNDL